MSRLPQTDRLPEKYTQFKLEYVDEYSENILEVILAYGDSVQLIKKAHKKYKDIDTSGLNNTRGRLGGKRLSEPITVGEDKSRFLRPDDEFRINIPALVEISPTLERREMFGIKDSGSVLITLSLKWLSDKKIIIDIFQDTFAYVGELYKIISANYYGSILSSKSIITYNTQKI
jgi:hypothetical protein